MKKHLHTNYLLIAIASFLLTFGCSSPQKNIDQGDFDSAIETSLKRLAGKGKKKTDMVLALEEAFNKVTARDIAVADRLKGDGRAENWPKIYNVYRTIRNRQEKITPYLPVISDEGVKATFKFVRIEALEREAKEKAAEYHYTNAEQLIERARDGDRIAGRNAFEALNRIDEYYQNYKNKRELKDEALELGTTFVYIAIQNRAPVTLPLGFEEELLRLDGQNLNANWKEIHTRRANGIEYDYKIVVNLVNIAVSPDRVKESEYEQRATVEDGWEYVLDAKGNVAKDSLGNDIKRPKEVEIIATVLEAHQTKAATLTGAIEFIELRTGALIDREELTAEAYFENFAATFSGDERALEPEVKKRIGNRPIPFPSDEQLLMDAAIELKPVISRKIRNNRRMN